MKENNHDQLIQHIRTRFAGCGLEQKPGTYRIDRKLYRKINDSILDWSLGKKLDWDDNKRANVICDLRKRYFPGMPRYKSYCCAGDAAAQTDAVAEQSTPEPVENAVQPVDKDAAVMLLLESIDNGIRGIASAITDAAGPKTIVNITDSKLRQALEEAKGVVDEIGATLLEGDQPHDAITIALANLSAKLGKALEDE